MIFLRIERAFALPWPDESRAFPINPSPAWLCAQSGAAPGIRLRFALSCADPDSAAAYLALAAKKSLRLYVAEFTLAERNLAIPAHCLARILLRNPAFWRAGALRGLAARTGLEHFHEQIILGGAALIARLSQNAGS